MALQKWAAPAGSPLLATTTATGNPGNQPFESIGQVFGSSGDIAVGAVLRVTAHGTITTTSTPTATLDVSVLENNGSTFTTQLAAPAGVTAQTWRVEALVTYDGINARYSVKAEGYFGSDLLASGVVTVNNLAASWTFSVGWDSTADDADSGDIIVIHGAVAEWIG